MFNTAQFSSDVFEAIELKNVVASKKSVGGTSYQEVEKQVSLTEGMLSKNEEWLTEKNAVVKRVEKDLFAIPH